MSGNPFAENVYEAKAEQYDRFINERLLRYIPANTLVLDVGCSTGRLGERLIAEKQCEVYGIDISERAVAKARPRLTDAVCLDIENDDYPAQHLRFDVILMADILEHLVRPEAVLQKMRRLLTNNGFILVSLPNIANLRIRLRLLVGQWEYRESGILDNTHLRFYTRKSAQKMFAQLGFQIVAISSTPGFDFLIGKLSVFKTVTERICQLYPRLFANQFIFILKPDLLR